MTPTLAALLRAELSAAEFELRLHRAEREAVRAARQRLSSNLEESERTLNRKITLVFARVKAAQVLLSQEAPADAINVAATQQNDEMTRQ